MSFVSEIRPGEMLIDDAAVGYEVATHGKGYEARDWEKEPYGSNEFAKAFDLQVIPRSEWKERIQEMEAKKLRLSDVRRVHGLKSSNQGNTNYCWMHGVVNACRLRRAAMGLPYLDLSAASAAARRKGGANQGGWSSEAAGELAARGINLMSEWPANSRDVRQYDTAENRALAESRKLFEFTELASRSFDQLMTCVLLQLPVGIGLNWWGHLVCAMDGLVLESGGYGIRIWNSWADSWGDNGESVLTESKATPGDAIAVRSVSVVEA